MYEGMSNKQTWQISMFIANDPDIYERTQKEAKKAVRSNKYYINAVSDLADFIRAIFEEGRPHLEGIYGDLLTWTLEDTDWKQIAEEIIDLIMQDKDFDPQKG